MAPDQRAAGLSDAEANAQLARDGPNALPSGHRGMLSIILGSMREPMFVLLLFAGALYLVLGELHEGLLLFVMVGVTIGVTLYQEGKTERALEALRDISSPRALVVRDGVRKRIAGSEVVRGDLLVLVEGDRVPADVELIEVQNLQIDESALTGESWPVGKRALQDREAVGAPGGDDSPFAWSGTLVVQGEGLARVIATGAGSELGKIGAALKRFSAERSPMQQETARLVRTLAAGGIAISAVVALGHGLMTQDWLQALLAGIALSMALLPEEFTVILTVFPAIGAWRLSRVQVLVRRLSAIETLGEISVLCTDKTGTLTENNMRVTQACTPGSAVFPIGDEPGQLPEDLRELARYAALASKQNAVDPMETAFHRLALSLGLAARSDRLVKEYPLSPGLRAMTMVWPSAATGRFDVAMKGAPEAVAELCRLNEPERKAMQTRIEEMAAQGLRVLAVARADCVLDDEKELPASQSAFSFRYLGLLALADPLRREIPDAVRECRQAGIRVAMITGDYPRTASSIGRQAGLRADRVLTGDMMDAMDDAALRESLRGCEIYARISPEQKLRIIQLLKADGEIVAMTGDGINDAPALKAAHVGIAMGGRGTDVARESSAIVLLDDNFASIVRGIRLGRRIFTNMQSAMAYVLAMHIPIAGMALLPMVTGWPVMLYPMHIAFLELIIDPACSLAFENEKSDEEAMRRPPRDRSKALFGGDMFVQSLLQGAMVLLGVAVAYAWLLQRLPEEQARAAAFVVLVIANLALIFSNLSQRQSALHVFRSSNRIPLVVAGAAVAILLLALYLPPLATAFDFSALPPSVLALAAIFGLSAAIWLEMIKFGAHKLIGQSGRRA